MFVLDKNITVSHDDTTFTDNEGNVVTIEGLESGSLDTAVSTDQYVFNSYKPYAWGILFVVLLLIFFLIYLIRSIFKDLKKY